MKRSGFFWKSLAIAVTLFAFVACESDEPAVTPDQPNQEQPGGGNEEPDEKPDEPTYDKMPTIALEAVGMTIDRLSFNLTSTDAKEVYWVCIKKGSREVSTSDVVENGAAVEVNTTLKLEKTGLEDNTTYEIYAVACNNMGDSMASLEMTTLEDVPPIMEILFEAENATLTQEYDTYEGFKGYYLTFYDALGNSFKAEFGASLEVPYLAAGTYTVASSAALNTLTWTTYMKPTDDAATKLASGTIEVEATPNEADYSVEYAFEGTLLFANGDKLLFIYEGPVAGIELPKPEEEQPDGREFVVSNKTMQTARTELNGEQPGEYSIKFYDEEWSELVLTFVTEGDGKAALPAGTYSIADGTINYANITFYSPSWSCYFTTCEVVVSVEGDTYTFVMTAEGEDAYATPKQQKVTMNYTGTVSDMVRS